MSTLLAYSGLATKVRAMKSRLLTDSEIEEIAGLRSVTEVVSYLSHHPGYSELFQSVDSTMMHRGNLEKILTLSRYKDFSKLYNFATIKQRKYLQLFFMKYEVALLKSVFRQIFEGKKIMVDQSILGAYFVKFSKISLDRLAETDSVEQCLEALKDTKFYTPLRRVYELGNATLFDYELCLDVLQFTLVWKNKGKYLSGNDLKIVTEDYGYRIDIINIQWIYRIKSYYHVSNADIYSYLIPIYYKLKKHEIKALVEAENINDMKALLAGTYYGSKLTSSKDSENLTLEQMYRQLLNRFHRKATKNNPYSLACVESYFYLKQKEISTLITMTECIRYSYSYEEILQFIR